LWTSLKPPLGGLSHPAQSSLLGVPPHIGSPGAIGVLLRLPGLSHPRDVSPGMKFLVGPHLTLSLLASSLNPFVKRFRNLPGPLQAPITSGVDPLPGFNPENIY